MELEKVKELAELFFKANYKDLFGAIVLYETIDFMQDLVDVNEGDLNYLEELYSYFMSTDKYSGIITDLLEDFNNYKEME